MEKSEQEQQVNHVEAATPPGNASFAREEDEVKLNQSGFFEHKSAMVYCLFIGLAGFQQGKAMGQM